MRIKLLSVATLLAGCLTAHADTIAGRSGGQLNGVLVNSPLAASFTAGSTYTDVSISAFLSAASFSGNGQGTVYLTSSIGAGTTAADQLASVNLSGLAFAPTLAMSLFSGLSLGPGTYYLVVASNTGGGGLGFEEFLANTDVATSGNTTNSDMFAFSSSGYPPASTFNLEGAGYNYTVSGTHVSVTPEPSTFVLLGTGIVCAAGVVRRRFA